MVEQVRWFSYSIIELDPKQCYYYGDEMSKIAIKSINVILKDLILKMSTFVLENLQKAYLKTLQSRYNLI